MKEREAELREGENVGFYSKKVQNVYGVEQTGTTEQPRRAWV